jgi:hypothetical protein
MTRRGAAGVRVGPVVNVQLHRGPEDLGYRSVFLLRFRLHGLIKLMGHFKADPALREILRFAARPRPHATSSPVRVITTFASRFDARCESPQRSHARRGFDQRGGMSVAGAGVTSVVSPPTDGSVVGPCQPGALLGRRRSVRRHGMTSPPESPTTPQFATGYPGGTDRTGGGEVTGQQAPGEVLTDDLDRGLLLAWRRRYRSRPHRSPAPAASHTSFYPGNATSNHFLRLRDHRPPQQSAMVTRLGQPYLLARSSPTAGIAMRAPGWCDSLSRPRGRVRQVLSGGTRLVPTATS